MDSGPDSIEARDVARRRAIFLLCSLVSAPAIAAFGVEDWRTGFTVEAILNIGLAVLLIAAAVLQRRVTRVRWIYRILSIAAVSSLTYQLSSGGSTDATLFWFFCLPPAMLFLLGPLEGTAILGLTSGAVVALAWQKWLVLSPAATSRFLVCYALVVVLTAGIEVSRRRYQGALEREKAMLQQALDRVRTLEGLLPVCAWCKQVRDEDGYWSAVEAYLERHQDVHITHGICPTCEKALEDEQAEKDRMRAVA